MRPKMIFQPRLDNKVVFYCVIHPLLFFSFFKCSYLSYLIKTCPSLFSLTFTLSQKQINTWWLPAKMWWIFISCLSCAGSGSRQTVLKETINQSVFPWRQDKHPEMKFINQSLILDRKLNLHHLQKLDVILTPGPHLWTLHRHKRRCTPLSKETLGFIQNKLDGRMCVFHSNSDPRVHT